MDRADGHHAWVPEITENQAKQLIELALDVDLYLGARLREKPRYLYNRLL
jgi:hypothetical protein